MSLAAIGKSLQWILERLAKTVHGVGSGVLAVLMFFTFVDVALRYFFNSPIKGDYEISSFMMAIVIPGGLALCALRKGHISVDVLTIRLPKRVQAALSVFAELITFGLLCLMVWQSAKYASLLYQSQTQAAGVPIPVYPFVIFVTIGLVVFALVALWNLVEAVRIAVRGPEAVEAEAAGIGTGGAE